MDDLNVEETKTDKAKRELAEDAQQRIQNAVRRVGDVLKEENVEMIPQVTLRGQQIISDIVFMAK